MSSKSISKLGYSDISPYRHNPYLDIETPQGLITMENTSMDLLGVDNKGNIQYMKANSKNPYKFQGNKVREIPTGNPYARGGFSYKDAINYLYDGSDESDNSDAPQNDNTAPSQEEIQSLTDRISQLEGNQGQQQDPNYQAAMDVANSDLGDGTSPSGTGNPYTSGGRGGVGESGTNPPVDNAANYEKGLQRAIGNPYNNLEGDAAAQYAFNYYKSQGLSPQASAGIVGNLIQESGNFRGDVISGSRKGDSGLATGIAQWHPDRLQGLIADASRTGKNPYTLNAQLDYVLKEATQRGDIKAIQGAKSADEAANIFAARYERPATIDPYRAKYAKKLYPYQKGGTYSLSYDEVKELKKQGYKFKLTQ